MQNNRENERKAADYDGGSFTSNEANRSGERTQDKKPGRESVAGSPSIQNDDSKRNYHAERHKSTEQYRSFDRVPSAGWREVYFSMGVDVR